MPYVFLALAIVAEVFGTSLLRATEGFTRFWPSVGVLVGYGTAAVLLTRVVQHLSVGVTYAIWSAVGTALIVAIATLFLGDQFTPAVAVGLLLVVSGVVVLNVLGPGH